MRITRTIVLDEAEIQETFVRSSGPGGQNVNKVATAVQLRFDVKRSPSLPEAVRERLLKIAGRRVTDDGILLIEARRYRTQERNRQDARDRLKHWILRATERPKVRKPTKPTRASKERRRQEKQRRSQVKRSRGKVTGDD